MSQTYYLFAFDDGFKFEKNDYLNNDDRRWSYVKQPHVSVCESDEIDFLAIWWRIFRPGEVISSPESIKVMRKFIGNHRNGKKVIEFMESNIGKRLFMEGW